MSAKKPAAKPVATLADLTPDPQNARKHNPRNIGQVQSSLQKYGAARSIVIDENNQIIAGHGVVEAAGLAGIERVQVVEADGETIIAVRRSGLTKKQKIELGIADNRGAELAEWDTDVLKGWAGSDIDLEQFWNKAEWEQLVPPTAGNDAEDPGAQVDKAAELQAKWGTSLNQLWQIGRHRLLVGDCTVSVNMGILMQGELAEMVWTDPPYGVAVGDKNKYLNSIAPSNRVEENLENDTLDEPGLTAMLSAAFDNALAVCLAGAAWYVAAPARPLHVLFGLELKKRGIWHQTIQWVKNNATFSPMGVDYHWRAEPIFYGWAPGAAHRYHGGRKQDTVWEIDRPAASPEHPTMKPVGLVARAVENSSRAGEIVLDPFCGSGTTLVACEKLGRSGRGMELSPSYAAVTLERLSGLGLTPELLP